MPLKRTKKIALKFSYIFFILFINCKVNSNFNNSSEIIINVGIRDEYNNIYSVFFSLGKDDLLHVDSLSNKLIYYSNNSNQHKFVLREDTFKSQGNDFKFYEKRVFVNATDKEVKEILLSDYNEYIKYFELDTLNNNRIESSNAKEYLYNNKYSIINVYNNYLCLRNDSYIFSGGASSLIGSEYLFFNLSDTALHQKILPEIMVISGSKDFPEVLCNNNNFNSKLKDELPRYLKIRPTGLYLIHYKNDKDNIQDFDSVLLQGCIINGSICEFSLSHFSTDVINKTTKFGFLFNEKNHEIYLNKQIKDVLFVQTKFGTNNWR